MTDAIILVPLFPLLAVLANLAFGKRMSETAVGIMASGAIGASFLAAAVSVFGLTGLKSGHPVITNSNKLRAYSSARFIPDGELARVLVTGELTRGNNDQNI